MVTVAGYNIYKFINMLPGWKQTKPMICLIIARKMQQEPTCSAKLISIDAQIKVGHRILSITLNCGFIISPERPNRTSSAPFFFFFNFLTKISRGYESKTPRSSLPQWQYLAASSSVSKRPKYTYLSKTATISQTIETTRLLITKQRPI